MRRIHFPWNRSWLDSRNDSFPRHRSERSDSVCRTIPEPVTARPTGLKQPMRKLQPTIELNRTFTESHCDQRQLSASITSEATQSVMMHSPRFEGWQPRKIPSIMLPLICWTKKSEEGGVGLRFRVGLRNGRCEGRGGLSWTGTICRSRSADKAARSQKHGSAGHSHSRRRANALPFPSVRTQMDVETGFLRRHSECRGIASLCWLPH